MYGVVAQAVAIDLQESRLDTIAERDLAFHKGRFKGAGILKFDALMVVQRCRGRLCGRPCERHE